MANLNTLFDFTKYEKRKVADQEKFENSNSELLASFIEGVNSSFRKLHTVVLKLVEPIDQDKNLCAIVMSGYLCGFLKRRYPGLCSKATRKRFRLWIDSTSVYVKKLDEKSKLPSNIPTDESLKIFYQLSDTGKDKGCNIFLGYTVNEAWSLITGIFAVCIEGEKLLWVSNLNNLVEANKPLIVPITPIAKEPAVKLGVKKRKKQIE